MWEKINQQEGIRYQRGDIPVHHRYTLGIAGERFFKAFRDERVILASKCLKCDVFFLPPKIYCEVCFERTGEWTSVSAQGYIKSFTHVHLSIDDASLEKMETIAVICWEGVRGGLIHRIADIEADSIKTGLIVEPVWASDRNGSLNDIEYFRPTERLRTLSNGE